MARYKYIAIWLSFLMIVGCAVVGTTISVDTNDMVDVDSIQTSVATPRDSVDSSVAVKLVDVSSYYDEPNVNEPSIDELNVEESKKTIEDTLKSIKEMEQKDSKETTGKQHNDSLFKDSLLDSSQKEPSIKDIQLADSLPADTIPLQTIMQDSLFKDSLLDSSQKEPSIKDMQLTDSLPTDTIPLQTIMQDNLFKDSLLDSSQKEPSIKDMQLTDSLPTDTIPLRTITQDSLSLKEAVSQDSLSPTTEPEKSSEPSYVDILADLTTQRGKGDTIIYFIGNVAFHHNGAIIECDSAKRYNDTHLECFGNVIINKDSAYIYGDRVDYNGNINQAIVHSPLVKMVRGDVTLLSYDMTFNTETSVAYYSSGGLMIQKDITMESRSGYYDASNNKIRFLDNVSMRTDDLEVKSDSMEYNMDSEVAYFNTHTVVWDNDSTILTSDKGQYDTKQELYYFTDNSYALNKNTELWSDTMSYYSSIRQAIMVSNVQILDTIQRTIGLGDWAKYDDSLKTSLLTLTPSIRSYNEQKNDTVYMRADTIFMFSYDTTIMRVSSDTLVLDALLSSVLDSVSVEEDTILTRPIDTLVIPVPVTDTLVEDDLADTTFTGVTIIDTMIADDTILDSLLIDTLVIPVPVTDTLVGDDLADTTFTGVTIIDTMIADDIILDSLLIDTLVIPVPVTDTLAGDDLADTTFTGATIIDTMIADDIILDSLLIDSIIVDSSLIAPPNIEIIYDTTYTIENHRIIQGYHTVKTWSESSQMVCDSLVGYTLDSLGKLYGNSILWSDNNQITSDSMIFYTRNSELDWAEFIGAPFITQAVKPLYTEPADSSRFNQATGKEMYAYFKNNEIDSVLMSGNVENYYYMDNEGYTAAFAAIKSSDLTMFFENRQIIKMRWEGQAEWDIFPIEDVPESQSQRLGSFTWNPEKQPQSAIEISDRVLRDSRRDEVVRIKKPLWNIEKAILKHREKILKSGLWKDRTDTTYRTPDYFKTMFLPL